MSAPAVGLIVTGSSPAAFFAPPSQLFVQVTRRIHAAFPLRAPSASSRNFPCLRRPPAQCVSMSFLSSLPGVSFVHVPGFASCSGHSRSLLRCFEPSLHCSMRHFYILAPSATFSLNRLQSAISARFTDMVYSPAVASFCQDLEPVVWDSALGIVLLSAASFLRILGIPSLYAA